MSRPYREHPAALPRRLSFYLWLFLLPLVRGMHLWGVPEHIPDWLHSHLPDRLVFLWLSVGAIALWWRRTYTLSRHKLTLRRGLVLRRTTQIPLSRITTLTVEIPLWLRPLGGARVVADTDAGNHRMADLRLTVPRRHIPLFLPTTNRPSFRAAGWRIGLLAVLSSDSFGGFLLLLAVLRHGSILLGEGLRQTVLNNLESAAEALALIPKTAAAIALALAAAWLAGVARLLLRHLPFSVSGDGETLTVRTGLYTRRIHGCALDAVNYLDRRQTLAAYLLGWHTAYISCTGYGKDRNTKAVLIPPCRQRQARLETRLLLPSLAPHSLSLHPAKGALWHYWRCPLILLGGIPLIGWCGTIWFPAWRALILYLAVMSTFPCFWFLAVRWIDRRTAGLGYRRHCYCLAYSRFLTLHRVTIPQNKVAMVLIRQSLWQRRHGTCTVKLFSHHEFRRPHPIRHLPMAQVRHLLNCIK